MADYYSVLGVRRDASIQDIKAAFRRLALQFHPDRHANSSTSQRDSAADRFKILSEAYEVLGNPARRRLYDTTGLGYQRGDYGYGKSTSDTHSYSRQRRASYSGARAEYSYSKRARASQPRPFNWAALMFHGVWSGIALCGFLFIDAAGDVFWERRNTGKSYEDMVQSLERERLEKDSIEQERKQ